MSANRVKIIYLLLYMGFAVWRVFFNVHLEEDGFSGAQIGTLNALMQATFFVVVPMWGIIADNKGIRPTLLILVLGSAGLLFFLGQINSFWILLFFIPLLTLFHHPLGPLTDALAIQYAESDRHHSFGSLRLWGSLGWAVASIIGGIVFTKVPVIHVFAVSASLYLILSTLLITYKRKKIYRPNFQKPEIKQLLRNRPLLIFIFILTFYGIACAPINAFLNLYFKALDSGNSIIGYAYAIMAFSELPFFFLGNKLIDKFGAKRIISIAMVAMIIRMMFYGLVPNTYLALFIGALQGISLSFFLVGAVDYMNKLMPAGMHATSQSIIWTTYVGIGQSVGALIIGPLIDGVGMIGVMKIFILVNIVCFVLTGWYFQRVKRKSLSY